jgi:N-hydroxyarylamine O-acetyltransferase
VIDAYLSLLGVRRAAPTVEYLFELHRAHVSRVPYTNVQIMRGRPASIEPLDAVRQVVDGHGGYCFHLNGAFSWLLRELGFSISLHRGYVYRHGATAAELNHLVLLAHDLEGGLWFVDTGLGDAIYEPLPLAAGHYSQGPFRYSLAFTGSHWRFSHDELGSFAGMQFEPAAAVIEDFAEAHKFLSTSPESSFTRFLTAQIRLADRVRIMRACTSVELDSSGKHESYVECAKDFTSAYASIGLSNVEDLWEGTRAAHEEWLTSL